MVGLLDHAPVRQEVIEPVEDDVALGGAVLPGRGGVQKPAVEDGDNSDALRGRERVRLDVHDQKHGEELLQHWMFGNARTKAATRLLGAYRDGHWLRLISGEDEEFLEAATVPLVVYRYGEPPIIDWNAMEMNCDPGLFTGDATDFAVVEVAVSLVCERSVNLCNLVETVDMETMELICQALRAAAAEDGPSCSACG